MGCQDVDLVRRMNLLGAVEHKNKMDGFTVSNQPEEFDRLLASDGKAKRKEADAENQAKLQHLPDFEKNELGSFAKICERIWKVNEGIETGVPTYRCAYNPRITVEGEARLWGDGVVVQPGFDRQEVRLVPAQPPSDTTDIPTPNAVLRESTKAHMRCQVLVVSLGTRTLAQVRGSDATVQMHVHGHRRLCNAVSEALGGLPDSVMLDTIDCRRLHGGERFAHVGLNPGVQAKYMADKHIMGEIADKITERGLFPLQFDDANPRLQRVVVAYCGSGKRRSPAIAVLMAAVLKNFGAEVSLLIHPLTVS